MLTTDNLILTRSAPDGYGGTQFIYRMKNYGLSAVSKPKEEIVQICWEVDVLEFKDDTALIFEVCHTTDLADKTLIFHNDKSLNEFLVRAFDYFKELNLLNGMLQK